MTLQEQADMAFLALTLWREARGETRDGKVAVAHSIMNRRRSPSWGNSVMSVIFQALQYSSLTHKYDAQLTTWPRDGDASWQECLDIANGVLTGSIVNNIDAADSYHDTSIQPPKWATRDNFVDQIGKLRFHRTGK